MIKTHLEPDFVPYDARAKYLTILRDPKEVIVSAYHFLLGLIGALPYVSFDEWYDLATRPDGMARSWAVHTAGWWALRERPNVLVFTYPEVLADPRGCIERVAGVLGVELTEPELGRVVERSSFAYMKAHESQFAPPELLGRPEGERARMVRRGKAGASDEALRPEQQAEVDRLCRAALRELGSDFPWERAFS